MVERLERLRHGFEKSLTGRNVFSVAALSLAMLTVMGLAADPGYHLQTLELGLGYVDQVLYNALASNMIGSSFTVTLNLLYGFVGGVLLTNSLKSLKNSGSSFKQLASALPGFAAAGCASCGLGLTAFLGLTGAAFAPFGGDLIMAAGLGLMLAGIYSIGDPGTCQV